MIKKFIFITAIFSSFLFGETQENLDLQEKNEIINLKKELTIFYDKKELEYKANKKELEDMLKKIEDEKAAIEKIKADNQAVLDEIKSVADNKTSKIYENMKPKVAASIFNKMMSEGNIEDVFDIIVKLKDKNIVNIMRYLDVEYAAVLTEKLRETSKR